MKILNFISNFFSVFNKRSEKNDNNYTNYTNKNTPQIYIPESLTKEDVVDAFEGIGLELDKNNLEIVSQSIATIYNAGEKSQEGLAKAFTQGFQQLGITPKETAYMFVCYISEE